MFSLDGGCTLWESFCVLVHIFMKAIQVYFGHQVECVLDGTGRHGLYHHTGAVDTCM